MPDLSGVDKCGACAVWRMFAENGVRASSSGGNSMKNGFDHYPHRGERRSSRGGAEGGNSRDAIRKTL